MRDRPPIVKTGTMDVPLSETSGVRARVSVPLAVLRLEQDTLTLRATTSFGHFVPTWRHHITEVRIFAKGRSGIGLCSGSYERPIYFYCHGSKSLIERLTLEGATPINAALVRDRRSPWVRAWNIILGLCLIAIVVTGLTSDASGSLPALIGGAVIWTAMFFAFRR